MSRVPRLALRVDGLSKVYALGLKSSDLHVRVASAWLERPRFKANISAAGFSEGILTSLNRPGLQEATTETREVRRPEGFLWAGNIELNASPVTD